MEPNVKIISIELPADVLLTTSVSEKELAREMREALAFKYFSEGKLSSGTAAKLAGMPRVTFLLKAGEKKIEWLPYSDDELRRELI
jgi:predicted HTH domain antitoxin